MSTIADPTNVYELGEILGLPTGKLKKKEYCGSKIISSRAPDLIMRGSLGKHY
jgi:hypothetical protein